MASHSRDSTAPASALSIRGLRKTYGHGPKATEALHGIDLEVPRGAFFGLLGPNGAGKSTLINILAGLVNKTAGTASVWGYDIDAESRAARCAIGVVPQELTIDPFFTPREMLELQAGLYGLRKAERQTDEILAAVGLADKADAYARTLSGGMRRRLLVAKAMVHSPPVLVLDEPTAGVDIALRQQFWNYIGKLNDDGTTVLLTTHYLEEAERFCDTIAIIHEGDLVACEATKTLIRRLDRKAVTVTIAEDIPTLPAALAEFDAELMSPGRMTIRYRPTETHVGDILAAVAASGLTIVDLSTEEGDLEEIFLALTSRAAAQ
ncbi:MAG: ABC transporter ATP-binding protein [Pseudomonadota bacterium]|nr:ABC transporter ATP-binding protein [Pseudomonadota bacterium]